METANPRCLINNLSPSHCYARLKCRCASCVGYVKKRYVQYKEQHKKVMHRNYVKNKISYRKRAFTSRLKQFGLTVDQFNAMLLAQNNLCQVCKQPETNGKRLSVDHSHRTGKVRGLLCNRCNVLLGWASDNEVLLGLAADYLRQND